MSISSRNSEDMKPAEIICGMQQQYHASYLSGSTIYEWNNYFKNGQSSLYGEGRKVGLPLQRIIQISKWLNN